MYINKIAKGELGSPICIDWSFRYLYLYQPSALVQGRYEIVPILRNPPVIRAQLLEKAAGPTGIYTGQTGGQFVILSLL